MFWCGVVKNCRKKLFNGQIAGFFCDTEDELLHFVH